MAPLKQNARSKGPIREKHFNKKFAHGGFSHNVKKKRKWVPDNKFFDGSLKEGQGFAFKRKEKIKHEYNKLLRKERKKTPVSKVQLEEEYPEHLRHLYLAERQRLDEEEQEKQKKRCKGRAVDEEVEADDKLKVLDCPSTEENISNTTTDQTTSHDSSNQPAQSDSFHKVPFIQRKQKMSSYQRTKQEYERMKEERAQKREEFLKDKAKREEAMKKYKEKKMATYQLLKRKTKKGQPNLNLQMELLLQKIQAQRK